MNEFIQSQGGIILTVLMVLTVANLFLSGLAAALDYLKDKTPSDIDNKAAVVIHKVLDIIKWVVDMLSANTKH